MVLTSITKSDAHLHRRRIARKIDFTLVFYAPVLQDDYITIELTQNSAKNTTVCSLKLKGKINNFRAPHRLTLALQYSKLQSPITNDDSITYSIFQVKIPRGPNTTKLTPSHVVSQKGTGEQGRSSGLPSWPRHQPSQAHGDPSYVAGNKSRSIAASLHEDLLLVRPLRTEERSCSKYIALLSPD